MRGKVLFFSEEKGFGKIIDSEKNEYLKKRLWYWKMFFELYIIPDDLKPLRNEIIALEKNIESFNNYRSSLKRDLGCKGIGRFLYLKIFEKIQIKSLDKKIDFVVDKDISFCS